MGATMRLPTLFILCVQAVLGVNTAAVAKSPQEVSGYLGENITLPSGVDPSWSLNKIEWSIFTNNTWIATYQQKEINTERFPQYTGRLTLNTRSGDLTIHNLKESDAMVYTVDLLNSEGEFKGNKIKLTAKQKLQEPSIQLVTSTSVESGCLMVVNCSSLDEGVNLSWSVKPVSVLTINKSHPSDSSAQLFAFVNTKENFASFTCISRRNAENISSKAVTSKCDRQISVSNSTTQPTPMTVAQPRARNLLCFFGGIGASVLFAVICRYVAQRRREEKKKRNQNEDPKKREREQKEKTEYKGGDGELVQDQGEPETVHNFPSTHSCHLKESPCSTVYA